MNQPIVSVCIPSYEAPEKLVRCVNSILVQDYEKYEIIITDDSVTNDIYEILNRLNIISRVTYIKNIQRLGSPENWNRCVANAKGKYIKIMHQDDWLSKKESLSEFVKAIEFNNADIAFCSIININVSSKKKRKYKIIKARNRTYLSKSACAVFWEYSWSA